MNRLDLGGVTWLEAFPGSGGWHWGVSLPCGDLYEAEELFRQDRRVAGNRLLLVKTPEGRVAEPIAAREGQYFGRPLWHEGEVFLLLADFPAGKVEILAYSPEQDRLRQVAELERDAFADCYNLQLHASPLCLTRQGGEGRFQVLWPDVADFAIGGRESFDFREGDLLYFSRWQEDPDYREEVVVRRLPQGDIASVCPGSILTLADGERWHLT